MESKNHKHFLNSVGLGAETASLGSLFPTTLRENSGEQWGAHAGTGLGYPLLLKEQGCLEGREQSCCQGSALFRLQLGRDCLCFLSDYPFWQPVKSKQRFSPELGGRVRERGGEGEMRRGINHSLLPAASAPLWSHCCGTCGGKEGDTEAGSPTATRAGLLRALCQSRGAGAATQGREAAATWVHLGHRRGTNGPG